MCLFPQRAQVKIYWHKVRRISKYQDIKLAASIGKTSIDDVDWIWIKLSIMIKVLVWFYDVVI